jgi:N-acetyl-anhydromuramoyl-L-alanine amidase
MKGKENPTLNPPSEQDSRYWLPRVRRVLTVNCNQRPVDTDICLLVIHNISLPPGKYGGHYIEQLFTNCLDCDALPEFDDLRDVEVSSHLLIDRTGLITQFVPFNQRAWHAGVSLFKGKSNCNDFSIGLELEGVDESPYTDQQYLALVNAAAEIIKRYPAITVDNIVGHSDIAPERKTDPGCAFDWDRFREMLTHKC